MAVVRRQRGAGFAKQQLLEGAGVHPGDGGAVALFDCRGRAQHLAVEARDPRGGAARHFEFDVAARGRSRRTRARGMTAKAVAPRASRLDAVGVRLEAEFGSCERGATRVSRCSSCPRSGTTTPIVPRRRIGLPFGR